MNPETHLILDISNLAHRAFHTTGELEYGGDGTGVLFGIFRDIVLLMETHNARNVIFCFDAGHDLRKAIYSGYKQKRWVPDMDEDDVEARRNLRKQIYRLRTKYLPEIGFRNILWEEGYEADDLIASVCENAFVDELMIVVSTDQDLWQLLAPNVIIWNPIKKKPITKESFTKEWGIDPSIWAHIKAIAGCKSDDVPGVKGVGEKTAVKFLAGSLKESTKAFKSIVAKSKMIERNLQLTRLPMSGLFMPIIEQDEVDPKQWDKVMLKLGMRSLKGKMR